MNRREIHVTKLIKKRINFPEVVSMSSSRMPYLFTILMGSLDPFPCLSEDEPPPEFYPRLEFRPDEDR